MTSKRKWIGVTFLGFVIAVLFGANGPLGGFWGVTDDGDDIPGGALAGLIGASLIEAIAFGLGLAWIAFGWKHVQHAGRGLALATYAAVAWLLVSWSPHTSFHQSWTEDDWYGLVGIEWGFHVTLVIAGMVIATYVWRTFSITAAPPAAATSG